MLNGCQVFRAVASAKEEPGRTGIREPKNQNSIPRNLNFWRVRDMCLISFSRAKLRQQDITPYLKNPRTKEFKNSRTLESKDWRTRYPRRYGQKSAPTSLHF